MMFKILTPFAFLAAQLIITWYGYFMSKVPTKGTFLGFGYDSTFVSLLIIQIKFVWVLILINLIFGLGFHWGIESYKNFMIVISLWIAAGPIAAVLFNTAVVKEPIDLPMIAGIVLIAIGAILVVTHEDISKFLS